MPNNFYGLRTWIPADAPRTFERLGGLAINYVKSVRVTATSSATCYLWPVSLSGNKWHNIPAGNRFASWQNCELRVMNEGRTSYGRQTKRQLLLSHSPFWRHYIITSLPLPLSLPLSDSPSLSNAAHMTTSWPHLQFVVLAFYGHTSRGRLVKRRANALWSKFVMLSPAPLLCRLHIEIYVSQLRVNLVFIPAAHLK